MMGGMTTEHLRRCVELAAEALAAGDHPFGSVLAGPDGEVLAEDRNRENTDADPTAHPELRLAQWAIANVPADQRAGCTVYTSGEHCPMCAAAHGWAGLGPIVYAASSAQLSAWRTGWGLPSSPVAALPITAIVPGLAVTGPVLPFDDDMRTLHQQAIRR